MTQLPMDSNNDGYAETLAQDTDGDGYAETLLVDTNADGYAETVEVDDDHDGYAETIMTDANLDGNLDSPPAGGVTPGVGNDDPYGAGAVPAEGMTQDQLDSIVDYATAVNIEEGNTENVEVLQHVQDSSNETFNAVLDNFPGTNDIDHDGWTDDVDIDPHHAG